MQATTPINLQTPINGAPSVQSSEKIGGSSANAFQTQIGQILSRNDDNGPDRAKKKTTENIRAANSSHLLRRPASDAAALGRPSKTGETADRNGPDCRPSNPPAGVRGDRMSTSESKSRPDAAKEVLPQRESDAGNVLAGSSQNPGNPSSEYPPAVSDSIANGSREPNYPNAAGRAAPVIRAGLQDASSQSKLKIGEKNSSFIDNLQFQENSDGGGAQSKLNGPSLDGLNLQSELSELSGGSLLESEPNGDSEKMAQANRIETSQNGDIRLETASPAIPISNTPGRVYAILEGTGFLRNTGGAQSTPLVSPTQFPEALNGAAPQLTDKEAFQKADRAGKFEILQNAENRPDIMSMMGRASKALDPGDALAGAKSRQGGQDDARTSLSVSPTQFPESSDGVAPQSGLDEALQRVDLMGKFGKSQNADDPPDAVPSMVSTLKTQGAIDSSPMEENRQARQNNNQPFLFVSQTRFPEFAKGIAPQSGSGVAFPGSDLAGKLEISSNAAAQWRNAPTTVSALRMQNSAGVLSEDRNSLNGLDGARPILFVSPARFPESSDGSLLQSGSGDIFRGGDSADTINLRQNSEAPMENAPGDNASAGKSQSAALATLELIGFGEGRSDQDVARSMPMPGIAVQGKAEPMLQNSEKPPATAAEKSGEGVLPPFSPNPVRAGDGAKFTGSAAESTPKTQTQEFIPQIAQRIQFQIREGKETIRIQLKPDSLGRIEIKAEAAANGVIARISTESYSVKNHLENNVQALQQTLQDQGLKVDRIYIVTHDGLDLSADSGKGLQFGHAGSGFSDGEARGFHQSSESATGDRLEEISLDPMTLVSLNPDIHFHTIA
jgi:hypothetical protein